MLDSKRDDVAPRPGCRARRTLEDETPTHTKTETNTRDRRHASGGWAQAKVQGLSLGRLTSRGLGPLGGTSEVQSKRGNATVFESSKANAVGTPLAKPPQREELRWKNKQRTYGKPSTKTSLGGDGSTWGMPTCDSDLRRFPPRR